ncbi:2',5'-phosphodiesterase 12 [Aricia agestis]|uniref:2',5'-phosphodiesterase 12 n=1 Tax=Aricia agestis TaxID=91739 RepID=UPI001C205AE8|nr:2',5'-phosphodiesterase 12 [Aricia agestis]
MVYRLLCFTRSVHSISKISKSNKMNLDKCYFRYIENQDKVDICFIMKIKDTTRQFNLNRHSSESLQTLCGRIATNVQKILCKKSKKKDLVDANVVTVSMFDENKHPLPQDISCLSIFDYKSNIKLKISEQVFDIVFNAPWVTSLSLPKSILVGFPVYPEYFETMYTDKSNSSFNWYRGKGKNDKGHETSDIHIKWEFLENSFYYIPRSEAVGMKLKLECIPGNSTCVGPAVEEISKNVVEAGPGHCPFETRQLFTSSKLNDESFRCVSYNILADLYCDSDFTRTVLHPYCPPYALHIDYRKNLLLKEITGYNADVVCLQEVGKKIFLNCLKPFLEFNGLDGEFYQKGKTVSEGLACFYRKDRFRLIEDSSILLADAIKQESYLKPIWHHLESNAPLVERLLDRSTVASASVLQFCDYPDEVLLIGNTHLYFHPDADHIRLIQGGIVIYWLQHLKDDLQKRLPNKRISVMLFGDFNSVPSCGIYKLYTTGIAPDTLPDWKSNEKEAVTGLNLTQNIQLASACGTPEFTNFTEGFADCLDYIFYEKNNLEVQQVVPFPSNEELRAHVALPSIVFPSDHIAIISDLKIKCNHESVYVKK